MSDSKLNTSHSSLQMARQAASQIVDDVDHLTFLGELPTGELAYRIFRTNLKNVTRVPDPTVTINPNLATATVEWTSGKSKYETEYRTFKIQGLVI